MLNTISKMKGYMAIDNYLEKHLAKSAFDSAVKDGEPAIKVIRRGDKTQTPHTITFVFSPWQSGEVMQTWIMKQVPRKSITYSISPTSLLLEDPVATSEVCLRVCEEAVEFVHKAIQNDNYVKSIRIIGLSVGTGVAAYVANKLYKRVKITTVDLVCPGAELSTALWHGSRTSSLRSEYESRGFTLEDIQKMWSKVDLINNLNFATEVSVRVSYSKGDRVIIPEQTKKVIERIKSLSPGKVVVKENYFLGHYLTMFWVWLNWRTVYRYSFPKPNKKPLRSQRS